MKLKLTLAVLATALSLAGCGGGSDQAEATKSPSSDVPASAQASVKALSQFSASDAKTETGKPFEINSAVLPTSESELPVPLK